MNDTIAKNSDTIGLLNKICTFCETPYQTKSKKSKYCSEACKQQVKRLKELHREGKQPQTPTDKQFAEHKPGFYSFGDTIRDIKCIVCGKKFKTTLPMLKNCSVECKDEMLRNLTGRV